MKAAKSGQSPVTPTLTGNSQARPFTRNSAFLNTSRYVMPSARPPQTPGACHHGSRVQRLGQRPFSSRQPPPRPGTPGPLETWGGGGGWRWGRWRLSHVGTWFLSLGEAEWLLSHPVHCCRVCHSSPGQPRDPTMNPAGRKMGGHEWGRGTRCPDVSPVSRKYGDGRGPGCGHTHAELPAQRRHVRSPRPGSAAAGTPRAGDG